MIFDPKEHTYSTPFNGKPGDAFNVARTALLSLGFEILVDSDSELKAEGPGMHSNRQPELLGVSLLQLNISTGLQPQVKKTPHIDQGGDHRHGQFDGSQP